MPHAVRRPELRSSARVYAAPVGLLGLFRMNSRVLRRDRRFELAGVIL